VRPLDVRCLAVAGRTEGPVLQPPTMGSDKGLPQTEAAVTAGDIGMGEYLEALCFEALARVFQKKNVLEGPAT